MFTTNLSALLQIRSFILQKQIKSSSTEWRCCLCPPSSLPLRGSDDDVPAAALLPQDGRPARPHHLPAAAALRGVGHGRRQGAHRGRRPDSASPDGEGRQQAAGAGIAAVVQLHQQGLSRVETEKRRRELYLRQRSLCLEPVICIKKTKKTELLGWIWTLVWIFSFLFSAHLKTSREMVHNEELRWVLRFSLFVRRPPDSLWVVTTPLSRSAHVNGLDCGDPPGLEGTHVLFPPRHWCSCGVFTASGLHKEGLEPKIKINKLLIHGWLFSDHFFSFMYFHLAAFVFIFKVTGLGCYFRTVVTCRN